jgi:dolichyl-phosphate beta-glucosyltransferase
VTLSCVGVVSIPQAATSLSVVIPAFNEASRLPATLAASLQYLGSDDMAHRRWEVIVCDDGSEDDTMRCVVQHPRVRLVRSRLNQGKGAALAAGVVRASGERILLMDADNGTPLSALPLLEEAMARTGSGLVLGSRLQSSRPWYRKLQGSVFRSVVAACIPDVVDSQCGFKLLTRAAARATFPHLNVQRWAYDVELIYLAQSLRLGVTSVAVPSVDVPGSKVRWHTPFEMLRDVLRVLISYRLGLWVAPTPPATGTETADLPRRCDTFTEVMRTAEIRSTGHMDAEGRTPQLPT